MPIRLGFIGLSTQGWASLGLVQPLFHPLLASKYTLVALCTRSEVSAAKAAQKYSELANREVKAYYGEHGVTELVHDPEVDMVAVSVKIPDHYAIVMQVIDAGKDLFVEWTPGNGYEETKRIAEAAKAKGIRVLVGAQGYQSTAVKKVKEIVDSGKIGRVLSTSILLTSAEEILLWGSKTTESGRYIHDPKNNTTILTILLGHFLVVLDNVLGEFGELTSSGAIRFPTGQYVDNEGRPTGEVFHSSSHDQVALSGTLRGKHDGTFVNIHCRAGVPCAGQRARGRRMFQWIIDGEDGTIEVKNRESDGQWGAFFTFTEKDVYLNGDKIELDEKGVNELGQAGKAWLEFAKGEAGQYTTLDDAVRVHRTLDAAAVSISEGKRVAF
ncbi:hypothetical protein NM688_g6384 [Phlebia brevispora]|uniref:Uncharacterized protein n=1 Tax=Phlebia brevispora TaxID=194682 RepID=A0ACC1SGJ7_9APHY|nr:hypothetical protein NM688_g6384 [Phlebia brevispora]